MQIDAQHQNPHHDSDRLLTPDQVIGPDFLNLPSKNWIYQRVHSGTLGFSVVKIGHYLRFRESEVRRYIEQQTRRGSAA
jgi:predicted DNA-binding transcriptional regulator AlpA